METHHGSTGDAELDMAARQALVDDSLAQLFAAYDQATSEGVRDPVAFLIDCEDEIGSQIARSWEGDDAVDAALLASASSDQFDAGGELATTLVRVFPYRDSCREVPKLFPYLAGTFAGPYPDDGFLVVVVAHGGAATFTAPFHARPSDDEP